MRIRKDRFGNWMVIMDCIVYEFKSESAARKFMKGIKKKKK